MKKDCHIVFPILFAFGKMDDFTVIATKIYMTSLGAHWHLGGETFVLLFFAG